MIDNFKSFGLIHILSLIVPIVILIIFILFAKKYDHKKDQISFYLVLLLIIIRSVRYIFDINLGVFSIYDLVSLHICHIDLIILIIALLMKKEKLFIFTFLIGIPTALAVALFPGRIHPEPGLMRAIFFIMSHMMLVISSIYMLVIYKYKITFKDVKFYYIFSFVGIIVAYIYNIVTKSNFMYLVNAPKKTLLETLRNMFGEYGYIISIYVILVGLLSLLYLIYKLISKGDKNDSNT